MTVEHRAAPPLKPMTVELAQRAHALALEVVDRQEPAPVPQVSLDERIIAALAATDRALPFAELREHCRIRTATLRERIGALSASGRIVKSDGGWRPAGQP